jgi:Glycosyltransferase family 87
METAGDLPDKKREAKVDPRLWLVFLIILPLLINTIWTPNNDFGTVSAIVREFVRGRVALYQAESMYYNYAPWMLLVYVPLSLFSHPFGQLIFNTLSICLLLWSVWYLTRPISWTYLAISIVTLYTSMLIIQGQWDAFILASLTLGWIGYQRKDPWLVGIALVGMTTKITNIILPLLILLFAIRKWPIKSLLRVFLIPLATLVVSFFVAGWDWPIRYLNLLKITFTYFDHYEVMTVFSSTVYPISYRLIAPPVGYIAVFVLLVISAFLFLRISRSGVNINSIYLGIALNFVVSPYITFHHLVVLAPLHASLLKTHRVWGVLLSAIALVDLLMLYLGVGLIIYPLAALLIFISVMIREIRHKDASISPLPQPAP